jgi:glycosyltransferase involved in cell wall biosynthesis
MLRKVEHGDSPMLSIIIPLYNKQDCIRKTLDSILVQDYSDYEIVIVDDGSTDNSIEVINSINDSRIVVHSKTNGGPSSARNYGVNKAKGEWILFLDADDTLERLALETVEVDIKTHRSADVFSYNEYIVEGSSKMLFNKNTIKGYVRFPFLAWYLDEIYPGPGRMVVRKSAVLTEPFREDLHRWEDGECIFRLMRRYRFYSNPEPIFSYNQNSLAASKPRSNYKEDFICQMNPKNKSFFEQMCMLKLYWEACSLYPEYVDSIYGDTFRSLKYRIGKKILYWYKKYFDLY